MSGPICPDCSSFEIEDWDGGNRCRVCGWQGGLLPRKRLHIDSFREYERMHARMRKARAEGRLFFLRIYLDSADADVSFEAIDILGVDTIVGPRGDPPYLFVKLDHDLSQEERDGLRRLKGVRDVKVF